VGGEAEVLGESLGKSLGKWLGNCLLRAGADRCQVGLLWLGNFVGTSMSGVFPA
jgi:hypothetical protein